MTEGWPTPRPSMTDFHLLAIPGCPSWLWNQTHDWKVVANRDWLPWGWSRMDSARQLSRFSRLTRGLYDAEGSGPPLACLAIRSGPCRHPPMEQTPFTRTIHLVLGFGGPTRQGGTPARTEVPRGGAAAFEPVGVASAWASV